MHDNIHISRVVVVFNRYDFEYEGVPPRTYGGRIDLLGDVGNLSLQLPPELVMEILELCAEPAVKILKRDVANLTVASVLPPMLGAPNAERQERKRGISEKVSDAGGHRVGEDNPTTDPAG